MKNLILSLTLVVIASCGGGGGGGGPTTLGATSSKEFFSTWTEAGTGYTYVMDAGDFNVVFTIVNTKVYVSSDWVDELVFRGKTNLPTAGQVYTCDYFMFVLGDNVSGSFALEILDTYTGSENNHACLQLDNVDEGGGGSGEFSLLYDHLYEISNNVMAIDWFGAGDLGIFGVDYYY